MSSSKPNLSPSDLPAAPFFPRGNVRDSRVLKNTVQRTRSLRRQEHATQRALARDEQVERAQRLRRRLFALMEGTWMSVGDTWWQFSLDRSATSVLWRRCNSSESEQMHVSSVRSVKAEGGELVLEGQNGSCLRVPEAEHFPLAASELESALLGLQAAWEESVFVRGSGKGKDEVGREAEEQAEADKELYGRDVDVEHLRAARQVLSGRPSRRAHMEVRETEWGVEVVTHDSSDCLVVGNPLVDTPRRVVQQWEAMEPQKPVQLDEDGSPKRVVVVGGHSEASRAQEDGVDTRSEQVEADAWEEEEEEEAFETTHVDWSVLPQSSDETTSRSAAELWKQQDQLTGARTRKPWEVASPPAELNCPEVETGVTEERDANEGSRSVERRGGGSVQRERAGEANNNVDLLRFQDTLESLHHPEAPAKVELEAQDDGEALQLFMSRTVKGADRSNTSNAR